MMGSKLGDKGGEGGEGGGEDEVRGGYLVRGASHDPIK